MNFQKMDMGRLGGEVVKRLPSAQGVILAFWDRAPRRFLCWEPASSSACVPSLAGCFSLCQIKK